jgi:hypothetical protein
MRTAGVKTLVEEVLASVPRPYSEDIIDEVFRAIEASPDWLRRYQVLSDEITKPVVNQSGGVWIAEAVGRSGAEQATATSTLISTYSKLRP